jgi:biotin carboxylase
MDSAAAKLTVKNDLIVDGIAGLPVVFKTSSGSTSRGQWQVRSLRERTQ